ncbi:MAG: DNA repair protein RecO [Candidatus Omnitrophota bacterium]
MGVLSTEGILLRKYFLRETSYLITFFTKDYGKIKGVIKGVRNPYPQFAGNFEIFTRCHILFYKKKKSHLDLITQCDMLDFFLPVRKEIRRLAYASYFIELTDIATTDYDINCQLYDTLVECLRMLGVDPEIKNICRIFEIKLLQSAGLSPELDMCSVCGSPPYDSKIFSVSSGGLVCGKCRRNTALCTEISSGALNFMRQIKKSELAKAVRFKASREVGAEIEEVLIKFLRYHINIPIKTLDFLGHLRKSGIA